VKKLLFLFSLILIFSCNENQENTKVKKLDLIKQNMFNGEVISSIYSNSDSTFVKDSDFSKKDFGILGMPINSSLGFKDEYNFEKNDENLILILKNLKNNQIHYFKIIYLGRNSIDMLYCQKSTPTKLQIHLAVNVGEKIKIPTTKSLSKFAKINSAYVFLEDQKIPGIN
jgi:hypothetical protein